MLSVWTDGLPSNLLAEFVGLICSIIATYLILNRLIARNRRRQYLPLKLALRRAAGQNVGAIALLWAFEAGRVTAEDVEQALVEGRLERIRGHIDLTEDLIDELEHSAAARADFLGTRSRAEVSEIARETFEDVTAIGEIASRVAPMVYEEIDLERLLAELEADALTLDHARSFVEYLSMSESREAPLDMLMVLAIRTYRGAQRVWNYLEKAGEERR
jgi:hypothetical protein